MSRKPKSPITSETHDPEKEMPMSNKLNLPTNGQPVHMAGPKSQEFSLITDVEKADRQARLTRGGKILREVKTARGNIRIDR